MTVYLIRHAQSKHNAFGTLLPNIDLSDYGKIQAKSLAGSPKLVIVSPLQRAWQTLEHSNIKYNHLMVSDFCREKCDGCIVNHFSHEQPYVETDADVAIRAKKFLELLEEQRKIHDEIYVITHALFIDHLTKIGFVHNCQKILYKS
jgi:broad specificity phosphatase PhoE